MIHMYDASLKSNISDHMVVMMIHNVRDINVHDHLCLSEEPYWLARGVRKGENFLDSKIFVAKIFGIKHVYHINFQICDKYA